MIALLPTEGFGVGFPILRLASLGDLSSGRRAVDFASEPAGQTGRVTSEQLEMISTDPQVMHGQAVIAGTRVPVSVILDCLAAGMTADEITAEYPSVPPAGVRPAAAYGAVAREELLPIPPFR